MSEAATYEGWRNVVRNQRLTQVAGITNPYGVECTTLVWDYAHILFPSVPIEKSITTGNAATLFEAANPAYFTKIVNDTADVKQLPQQGDIMVFGATPAKGHTSTFVNPNGHAGVCDSASSAGYNLLQQNAPANGQAVNVEEVAWNYNPCIGWLRPL